MALKLDSLRTYLQGGVEPNPSPPLICPLFRDVPGLEANGAVSLDVRLGRWFLSLKRSKIPLHDFNNQTAPTESELCRRHFVPFGKHFILHPQSFVLGATLEWVSMPESLCGSIVGKSSLGRHGLIIETAPIVHPGYAGCLTLEITNVGEVPLTLYPGMEIAQLVFDRADGQGIAPGSFVDLRRPTLKNIKLDAIWDRLKKAR